MPASNSLEPYLPPELEKLIFELAVSENGTSNSAPLLLIAKRVTEWIRPLIFRVMNQLRPAHSFTRSSPFIQSVGHFAQYLIIGRFSLSTENVRDIISYCPNVRDLAIRTVPVNDLLSTLKQMSHLTRLSASFSDVPYSEFLDQPFSNLTHLDILDINSASWEEQWESLTHLPKLTHIRMGFDFDVDVVSKFLLHCPLLQVLIRVVEPSSLVYYLKRDALDRIDDNRFVLLRSRKYVEPRLDWERGADGGVDEWIFGELIVFARGRKYFLRPLPQLIDRNFDWEEVLNQDGKKWFSKLRLKDA